MKSTYEELNNALESLPEDEFEDLMDSEIKRDQFLELHGWTYAEFKDATVDFWKNAMYVDTGEPYIDNYENT